MGRTIVIVLLLSWIVLSFMTISDPLMFQRVGSYGIAVSVIALGYHSTRVAQELNEIDGEISWTKSDILLGMIELAFRVKETGSHQHGGEKREELVTAFEKEKLALQKVRSRDAEISKRVRKINWSVFRLEMMVLVVATLQWGFGDLFSNKTAICGEWQC